MSFVRSPDSLGWLPATRLMPVVPSNGSRANDLHFAGSMFS